MSNVLFTMALLPTMKTVKNDVLWHTLASESTLSGNAAIKKTMTNLIVIGAAKSKGVKIKCMEFFRIGRVVTLISMILSFEIIYIQKSLL